MTVRFIVRSRRAIASVVVLESSITESPLLISVAACSAIWSLACAFCWASFRKRNSKLTRAAVGPQHLPGVRQHLQVAADGHGADARRQSQVVHRAATLAVDQLQDLPVAGRRAGHGGLFFSVHFYLL